MGFNKKFFTTGGIVASSPSAPAAFDPLQNFETVTYTGNGSTQKITGYIRKGAAFNGSSSVINLPLNTLDVTTDFTVSGWVNQESSDTQLFIFSCTDTNSNNIYFNISIQPTQSRIELIYNDVGYYPSLTYQTGWHHYAVTLEGTTLKTYVDGSLLDTQTVTISSTSGNRQTIGTRLRQSYSSYGKGKLDQVRIFNKALDQDDVDDLYLETYADPKKSTTDFFGDGSGVALYELDEDANDTGAPIDSGQSGDFNGSNSYIQTIAEPIPATTNFSLSFWINRDTSSNVDLFNQATSSGDIRTYFKLDSNGTFSVSSAGTNGSRIQVPNTSIAITNGIWHHIAIVRNGSTMTFYINGISENETISGGTIGVGRGDMTIGSASASPDARIDDIRIFNDALTSTEVGYLKDNNTANIATINNFIAHYKLDGDAVDSVGSGTYSGTEYNLTYSDPAERTNNGTPTNINFLGMAFQPDFVWIKNRDQDDSNQIFDSVRGEGFDMHSDTTAAQPTTADTTSLTSFDSNGFTLSTNAVVNTNTEDYVAWCWKASDTTVTDSSTGDITADIRANTAAGFSIVDFNTGTTNNVTVPHGLDSPPELIILKSWSNSGGWQVYAEPIGAGKRLKLHKDDAADTNSAPFNNTAPDSDVFTIGNVASFWVQNNDYIAYCFHSVDAYQKVGSFNYSDTSVTTDFKPRLILIKRTDNAGSWNIFDYQINTGDVWDNYLRPNTSQSEASGTNIFTVTDTGFNINYSFPTNSEYIYLAIA